MSTIQFAIPKDHPLLPALMEAARSMPDVTIDRPGGVAVALKQLAHTDAYVRFFRALERVVGTEVVGLTIKNLREGPARQPVAKLPDPVALLASLGGAGHDVQAIMSRLAQQLGTER